MEGVKFIITCIYNYTYLEDILLNIDSKKFYYLITFSVNPVISCIHKLYISILNSVG